MIVVCLWHARGDGSDLVRCFQGFSCKSTNSPWFPRKSKPFTPSSTTSDIHRKQSATYLGCMTTKINHLMSPGDNSITTGWGVVDVCQLRIDVSLTPRLLSHDFLRGGSNTSAAPLQIRDKLQQIPGKGPAGFRLIDDE
ncbi:hypothetical protein AAFF_G00201600 [Aldrovandia affinis]|uniref:Uncharacterized protein n=1 Tax=Aldrovandia affinis TaxID=143900 RepID=A0AAD7SWQ4_9TELE|nr:hypothetical protein AAFF_G00201600 [Aldrovandia affinis]